MESGNTLLSKVLRIFGFFMVAFYIGIGIIFLFFKIYPWIPREYKVIFGVFLIIYGLFRLVRLLNKTKEEREES